MAQIIAPTTSTATATFRVISTFPATLHLKGFAANEDLVLKIQQGSDFNEVVDVEGTPIVLNGVRTMFMINATGTYKVEKSSTVAAGTVYLEDV